MTNWLLVFLGGGLGSVARYGLARMMEPVSTRFPWGTFAANLLACFLLALFFVKFEMHKHPAALFLMTGFCGGFSTFSTFTMENYKLLQAGHYWLLAGYVFLSVITCLIGFILGLRLGNFV